MRQEKERVRFRLGVQLNIVDRTGGIKKTLWHLRDNGSKCGYALMSTASDDVARERHDLELRCHACQRTILIRACKVAHFLTGYQSVLAARDKRPVAAGVQFNRLPLELQLFANEAHEIALADVRPPLRLLRR